MQYGAHLPLIDFNGRLRASRPGLVHGRGARQRLLSARRHAELGLERVFIWPLAEPVSQVFMRDVVPAVEGL